MRELGKTGKLENSGKPLMQRCFAVKSNKENGIVDTWERGFESLRPDQHEPIDLYVIRIKTSQRICFFLLPKGEQNRAKQYLAGFLVVVPLEFPTD